MAHGLVGRISRVRPESTKGESVAERRERKTRESRLRSRGLDEIGPVPTGCHWIDACDRGADVFEFPAELTQRKRRDIVRSCHHRALGSERSDANAHWTLEIPAQTGVPARRAELSGVAWETTIRPPHVRKGTFEDTPIGVTIVRVWETNPPDEADPLEWRLLTNEPAETPGRLRRIGDWYSCRMRVEEYHEARKSGARVEGCRVQNVKAMASWVAVLSVLSVWMMNPRLAAREPMAAERTAEAVVPPLWVSVPRRAMTASGLRPKGEMSVRDFWHGLARLDGYKSRTPGKTPPGWQTPWQGWVRMNFLIRDELSTPKMC